LIPIIVVEGATATGKTSFAINLAKLFDTEIISADSRQVYKYLNIGTAKPSKEELSFVRHHMIGIIAPNAAFNAGLFTKKVHTIINKLSTQGKIPIVCGGTGLYVKALLDGLFISDIQNDEIRKSLTEKLHIQGLSAMYEELRKVDEVTAAKLSCNDKQRILRALEVYYTTDIPISEHWCKQVNADRYAPFRILLETDREMLYDAINKRIHSMLSFGLFSEIKAVLQKGYSWSDPGFNSVGYKEFRHFIETGSDLEGCISLAQQHTRNYAKRQITWYRKCNFNLACNIESININSVEKVIRLHFKNLSTRGW